MTEKESLMDEAREPVVDSPHVHQAPERRRWTEVMKHFHRADPAWPAETRRVIAAELQGHGRTADIDRPITYEHMADDVAGREATMSKVIFDISMSLDGFVTGVRLAAAGQH